MTTKPSIVFIGPWNFHSGAGQAARGNLQALWRLQDKYSIFPLGVTRYGPHRLSSELIPTVEANLCPDIVIVHLNPDTAPSLLTPEHQKLIHRSRHRIGLWIWENLQVPHGWSKALGWIDSLWVPSSYCRDLFGGLTDLPISVIPHVIPVARDRDSESISKAEIQKQILYIFDGASYLRRKNPAALVRAFHQSTLTAQGWRLCLKTKNFDSSGYDQASYQEFRHAMHRLEESCPGSLQLISADLDQVAINQLMATAAIYASPHASEGFGLTIAEAMASGSLVVATDYGGSRDFLDAETGFPVRYTLKAEPLGYGSYQSGCVWASVDEVHLSECLQQAATLCSRNKDRQMRQLAKQRIADHRSVDVVARLMQQELQLILSGQS